MWVDAVIFVFSLEDEISFQTVYHYYSRMANYRNTSEIPLVLVGTQGEWCPRPHCVHGAPAVQPRAPSWSVSGAEEFESGLKKKPLPTEGSVLQ